MKSFIFIFYLSVIISFTACQENFDIFYLTDEKLSYHFLKEPSCEDSQKEWSELNDYFDIVVHYSPVIYQGLSWKVKADYITNFDYDKNIIARDNWENLYKYPLKAYVYYSVVETLSHLFIGYFLYYPQSYGTFFDNNLESYENNMNGIMLIIEKNENNEYGNLILMETFYKGKFLHYTRSPKVRPGSESIDGEILFQYEDHPAIFVEPRNHGIFVPSSELFVQKYKTINQYLADRKGVIYWYKGEAEEPQNGNEHFVGYELLPLLETLWPLRNQIGNDYPFDKPFTFLNGCTYGGRFNGDNFIQDRGTPPWAWDEIDDGAVSKGEWFFIPAHTIAKHFKILGEFSLKYIYNPYIGIEN